MIQIELTQGFFATVDESDKDLDVHKWYVDTKSKNISYAARRSRSGIERMHRVILGRKIGRDLTKEETVDHIDHNGLNNQRANLRIASTAENTHNQRIQTRSKTSKYKGVYWYKTTGRWRARIKVQMKYISLGYFDREEDAARAYNEAALKYFGEFACINNV